jgi:hypothetical protein
LYQQGRLKDAIHHFGSGNGNASQRCSLCRLYFESVREQDSRDAAVRIIADVVLPMLKQDLTRFARLDLARAFDKTFERRDQPCVRRAAEPMPAGVFVRRDEPAMFDVEGSVYDLLWALASANVIVEAWDQAERWA